MAISSARTIAYDVLHRVEAEGAYASDTLHAELGSQVAAENAALATEITFGVLRWRRLLDFLLDHQLKKPAAELELPVALALRMGLYQLRYLVRIPARAAVNESVELVKRARKSSAAGLVNAVLRRFGSENSQAVSHEDPTPLERLLPPNLEKAERLGILNSHPTWLVARWLKNFGQTKTVALLEANNRVPHLTCALHDEPRREEIFAQMQKSGLRIEPGALLNSAFIVNGGSAARTRAFREGATSIQDEASQAIPLLLGVKTGDSVLDLCAAPGGKTPPLVRGAGPRGFVVAADRHAHRLRAMRSQFERLGIAGSAHIVELDAAHGLPFNRHFDRILVDAPCSGTGTLARHPEIRWRLRPEQLSELHAVQVAILSSAARKLESGGRLVYSTCSLEPEENERVVSEVLTSESSVRLVLRLEAMEMIAPRLASTISPESLFDSEGQFRTSPSEHHTDGFFAAIIEK